jgi:hypothetical protein
MKLNIFISWSGPRSRKFAHLLSSWLKKVLAGSEPWISDNIEKGKQGFDQISKTLLNYHIGIICITPENIKSPWIHFEAGAISKVLDKAKVCPILLGMQYNSLEAPLSNFQATLFNKNDMFGLLRSLNNELKKRKIDEKLLLKKFEKYWCDFEKEVIKISKTKLYANNLPDVINNFSRQGITEPEVGNTVFFHEGFETHALYKAITEVARKKLYIFGRKNRKLFDKEHFCFFENLSQKISRGFDFKVLFLDPGTPKQILGAAHSDPDFRTQLAECIKKAVNIFKKYDLNPQNHFRFYSCNRTSASIIADEAVLFSPIRLEHDKAKSLTNSGFILTSVNTNLGKGLLDDIKLVWTNSKKL